MAVRLDAPSDGTRIIRWASEGVLIEVFPPVPAGEGAGLRTGDLVRAIEGYALTDRPGSLPEPASDAVLTYVVERGATSVRLGRLDVLPLVNSSWGNLVFVGALALLAVALRVRRPDEPATAPLLVAAGGMLGSTLAMTTGVSALAQATGGPQLWLYNLSVVGAYAIAWGALLAFGLSLRADPAPSHRALLIAWLSPPIVMSLLVVRAATLSTDWPGRTAAVHAGTGVVAAGTLVAVFALGLLNFLRSDRPGVRARLAWVAGGSVVTAVLSLVLWQLPEMVLGYSLLPPGALGLSGLPFLVGIAIALRRHRLFDIERLANRSLTYLTVTAVLLAAYALVVALLGSVLGLTGGVAAALAAVVAALALAPLLRWARGAVNRLMYGDRDDPSLVLGRLGDRMQAVMLPDDVLPVVVQTVAQSLRLPYAAIDLPTADGGFQTGVRHGRVVGAVHTAELRHHGTVVGHLRVCDRGVDDPLEDSDLALLESLASEIGPAVQAVRLHQDLLRSRAEVVALREDERRRLRRDLHDGLGPALAAIGLKAGLAAREVPRASMARVLLDQIDGEVKDSLGGIRRLVEGLRPPALDELGLLGAVSSRAGALAAELEVEVTGELPPAGLPAAVETAAYWIAVEAVTNAARHSGGTHCAVDLRTFHDVLVVVVADDGTGPDPTRPSGVGQRSMRERAVEVGGSVIVHGGPSGTEVVARLPLTLGGAA